MSIRTREGRHYLLKEKSEELRFSTDEKICIILIINEYSIRKISIILHYSESYIDVLIASVKKKFNAKRREKVIAEAIFHGIITNEMCSHFKRNQSIPLLIETFFKN